MKKKLLSLVLATVMVTGTEQPYGHPGMAKLLKNMEPNLQTLTWMEHFTDSMKDSLL